MARNAQQHQAKFTPDAYKNNTNNIVIMLNGTNITSIYNSFIEFKKMFGVEFPDDRRIAFTNADGELIILKYLPFNVDVLNDKANLIK